MKIAQIIYNYHGIKPDKTLDIYIFKLLSCINFKPYSMKVTILKMFCINPR